MSKVYVITELPGGAAGPREERVRTRLGDGAGGWRSAGRIAERPVPRWFAVAALWLWRAARVAAGVLAGMSAMVVLLVGAVVALMAALVGVPAPGWWAQQMAEAYRRAAARVCTAAAGGIGGKSEVDGDER